MPLKLLRRPGSDTWYIHGTVAGQRIRQAAGTADRRIAEEARAQLEARLHRAAVFGPKAVVTFAEAVDSYTEVNPPSPLDARHLLKLVDFMGPKRLADINQALLDQAIRAILRPNPAAATKLRNVIGPARAVLTHAARRGWCDLPALETPRGSSGVKRTRWLTPAEFRALHAAASPHLRPLLVFLVGTGARMGEALLLDWREVNLTIGRVTLHEDNTKAGRARELDIPPAVVVALANLAHREGRVFRPPPRTRGKVVVEERDAYADTGGLHGGQIGTAFSSACRRAGFAGTERIATRTVRRPLASGEVSEWRQTIKHWTPADVTPHTLRHTWASWRYCYHRDLVRLREEGGWASTALAERYTKLCPPELLPEVLAVWGVSDTPAAQSSARRAARR
jgi:integrase